MKRKMLCLLLLVGVACLLVGCIGLEETEDCIISWNGFNSSTEETVKEMADFLEECGLFGEHPLERFKTADDWTSSSHGRFFLASGSINGEAKSFQSLRFAWRSDGERIVISSLPMEKIVIIVDEAKYVPTIRFKFLIDSYINPEKRMVIIGNANSAINPELVVYATIRINSADLEEEIYLPFNSGD
jgi:hypothetical protein